MEYIYVAFALKRVKYLVQLRYYFEKGKIALKWIRYKDGGKGEDSMDEQKDH